MRCVVAAALALGACSVDARYAGTAFRCDEGHGCPRGQTCVDGLCGGPDTSADGGDQDDDGGEPSSYVAEVLTDDPILYLRFDELAGTTAEDSGPGGRHGLYAAGVTLGEPGAFAASGASAHFDGVDDHVVVPDDAALRLDGDFSIEFWFLLDEDVNAYPGVIRKGQSADDGYLIFYSGDGHMIHKRADLTHVNNTPLVADQFRHVVLTYVAGDALLSWYVDGVLDDVSSVTYPDSTATQELTIGRGDHFGRHWLDEVALYAVALPIERVEAHHAAATGTPAPAP